MTDAAFIATLKHDVTIARYTTQAGDDEHGNRNAQYVPDAEPTKMFVQPDGETEFREGGELVIAEYAIFAAPTTNLTTRDRLLWDGRTLKVIGITREQDLNVEHHKAIFAREVQSGPS